MPPKLGALFLEGLPLAVLSLGVCFYNSHHNSVTCTAEEQRLGAW